MASTWSSCPGSPPAQKRAKWGLDEPGQPEAQQPEPHPEWKQPAADPQQGSLAIEDCGSSTPLLNGNSHVNPHSQTQNHNHNSNGLDSGFSDGGATGEESQESFSMHDQATSSLSNPLPGPSGYHNHHYNHDHNHDSDPPHQTSQSTEVDNDDNVSEISGMSDLSGSDWKPNSGPVAWVHRQMKSGADPRHLLQEMLSKDTVIPADLDQLRLWKLILNIFSEPPRRSKLNFVNTLDNVVELIKTSSRILVLTGAGVSVSCGIPDFRSKDGVYARLAVDYPDLPDPQAMFDIHYFRKDPRPFFKFAKELYPGQFQPSPCHRFIRNIEKQGKLLRNYTQNIDTLEQMVGLKNVVECHGSFATATCTKCRHKVKADVIREDIFLQRIPYCTVCQERLASQTPPKQPTEENSSSNSGSSPNQVQEQATTTAETETPSSSTESSSISPPVPQPGIMKPDIVFFGENLGDEFHQSISKDKEEADLLIMIGSSLKVRPVALIPSSVPPSVPQVLINREPLSHLTPDVQLLGDCDEVVNQLANLLGDGWQDAQQKEVLTEVTELPPLPSHPCPTEFKTFIGPLPKPEESASSSSTEADNSEPTTQPTSSTSTEPKQADSLKLEEEAAVKTDGDDEKHPEGHHQHLPSEPQPDPRHWQLHSRMPLSSRLPANSYLYQPPCTYVFPGAEIYSDDNDGDSSGDDSSSDEEEEQQPHQSQSPLASQSTAPTSEPEPAAVLHVPAPTMPLDDSLFPCNSQDEEDFPHVPGDTGAPEHSELEPSLLELSQDTPSLENA